MANLIFRTLIIYFSLLLTMRLLGKRQLGEMELSEFVVAALMADIAAIPLQEESIPLYRGLLPVFVLFCCELLIAWLSMKNIRLRSLLFGKPSLLIVRGEIDQAALRKNRFTCDELMQELRSQSITDISTIEYAVLETNGTLSVILSPSRQPPTAAQLGLETESEGYPIIVISDGRTVTENLEHMGKDNAWLKKELEKRGVASAKKVFLMTLDKNDKIYLSEKD